MRNTLRNIPKIFREIFQKYQRLLLSRRKLGGTPVKLWGIGKGKIFKQTEFGFVEPSKLFWKNIFGEGVKK